MLDWRPASGQVVLIELAAGGDDCFTGIVLESEGGAVVIDLGASPRPTEPECEVTASFFSSDALYRIAARLCPHGGLGSVIDLVIHDIERVQRRVGDRAKLALQVVLTNLDDPDLAGGDIASVHGESIDIGEGGCRVIANGRFPSGCDPTVTVQLSPDDTLVALAAVLQEQSLPDGRYEYRLVFTDPEDGHRQLLAAFIANANA